MATGYGLDDLGFRVRDCVEIQIFLSPYRPGQFWSPLTVLSSAEKPCLCGVSCSVRPAAAEKRCLCGSSCSVRPSAAEKRCLYGVSCSVRPAATSLTVRGDGEVLALRKSKKDR
jgi:hypothetical protein